MILKKHFLQQHFFNVRSPKLLAQQLGKRCTGEVRFLVKRGWETNNLSAIAFSSGLLVRFFLYWIESVLIYYIILWGKKFLHFSQCVNLDNSLHSWKVVWIFYVIFNYSSWSNCDVVLIDDWLIVSYYCLALSDWALVLIQVTALPIYI